MSKQERVAVFIDSANLYAATRSLEFDTDYRKMLAEMKSWGGASFVYFTTQRSLKMKSILPFARCWIGLIITASQS
jgi:hypothetical protein